MAEPLPGTELLTDNGDLAAAMVAGIDRYLERATRTAAAQRETRWRRDRSSHEAYERSLAPNRERLKKILGLVDPRIPTPELELVATHQTSAEVAETDRYRIYAVRWPVYPGVHGEGLLLEPRKGAWGGVVALPDCDATPEMLCGLTSGVPLHSQFARRFVENGLRVLIPVLIDRGDDYSGRADVRWTNQPHREFLYRAAFEMGRHPIGFEVAKVQSALDWLEGQGGALGVAGYGEGGLIAQFAAAVDTRIQSTWVSGYFGPRERLWSEPIYRNVWAQLREFGDRQVVAMIAPRALVVEACNVPDVDGPPPPRDGRSGAAPGMLTTPAIRDVDAEFAAAIKLFGGLAPAPKWVRTGTGEGEPGSEESLAAFLIGLGRKDRPAGRRPCPKEKRSGFDPEPRRRRQFDELLAFTQHLLRESEFRRSEYWRNADGASEASWRSSTGQYREALRNEVIGSLPKGDGPLEPRSRLIYDESTYRGYEVTLRVWDDVFAYGILLVPKSLKPGERRPVVVCQHGLEGRPTDVANPALDNPAYHRYACRLAERGFITFAPQNPYIGQDKFRVLQRKANPLKASLFSIIVRQHERILDWLETLEFVDPSRIAFYGLSYGGKTAMRVPALLDRYCLSICSADYNEWIWKNASARHRYSYLFTGEYEMVEFDLGNTFNYAEMSWLICPRPFMVERGHDDGVAPDEWVAYEFARTRQRYDRLKIGDRVEMEVFLGPHTIHGVGTFDFLHRHLKHPAP